MRTVSLITLFIFIVSSGCQGLDYGLQSGSFQNQQDLVVASNQCGECVPMEYCACGINCKPRGGLLDLIRSRRANHQATCNCGTGANRSYSNHSTVFYIPQTGSPGCEHLAQRPYHPTHPSEKAATPPSFISHLDGRSSPTPLHRRKNKSIYTVESGIIEPPSQQIANPVESTTADADLEARIEIAPRATIPMAENQQAVPTLAEPESVPGNVQAQPVSISSPSDFPRTDLPEPERSIPFVPIYSTPIQGPVKDDVTPEPDAMVVLIARPTGNHNFKPRSYGPVVESDRIQQPTQTSMQASTYPSNTAYDDLGLPLGPVGFQSLPQMSLPNFQSPAVAKRARAQMADLRAESNARRKKEQLFDIQALISYEIDKRIREGKLQPVVNPDPAVTQPAVQPRTNLQAVAPKSDNPIVARQYASKSPTATIDESTGENQNVLPNSKVRFLQVSQPMGVFEQPQMVRPYLRPIRRPIRHPSVPVHEFEFGQQTEAELQFSIDSEFESHVFEQETLNFEIPNVLVPVLETSEPWMEQSIDTEFESAPVKQPQTSAPRLGIIQINTATSPIDLNPEDETVQHQTEILRLRATTRPENVGGARPVAKFRNVSTQYRYQKTRSYEERISPEEIRRWNRGEEPGSMEIRSIRARPIFESEALQREIRGLTELPSIGESKGEPADVRIIDR